MLKSRDAGFVAELVIRLLPRLLIQRGAAHHFGNPLLAGSGCFGAVYPEDVLKLLAVGELTEITLRYSIGFKRLF